MIHGKKMQTEKYMNPLRHHLEGGIKPHKDRAFLICEVKNLFNG